MSIIDIPPHDLTAAQHVTPVKITVYHNHDARFMPYEDGQLLTPVTCHWLEIPAEDLVAIGEWVFRTFNADLDVLETGRRQPGGETTFLAACVYRLLGHRSVSVGDVIAVDAGPHTHWLACDPVGWRPISEPTYLPQEPLSATVVYGHLTDQRRAP